MGRKLNISTPMTLDVMLAPFTETFQILASDTLQQWYYDEGGSDADSHYVPNRQTSPLALSPQLEVYDPDTHTAYTPSFGDVRWFYSDTTNTSKTRYADDGVTSATGTYAQTGYRWILVDTSDVSADMYVPTGTKNLMIRKNVNYNSPITILCIAPWLDPRGGESYQSKATVDLTTNRDATIVSPTISIQCEDTIKFDIFKDMPLYTLQAKVMKGGEDITATSTVSWWVQGTNNTETPIDFYHTLSEGANVYIAPCYVSGQGTSTLVLNAMYAEDITIVARIGNGSLYVTYPTKAIVNLKWDDIPMDIITQGHNSGAVRSNTVDMMFSNIVNIRHRTLVDVEKADNILFNWKRRNQKSTTIVDSGWGQEKILTGNELRQYNSSIVYAESYLEGAYDYELLNGSYITDTPDFQSTSAECVLDRTINVN